MKDIIYNLHNKKKNNLYKKRYVLVYSLLLIIAALSILVLSNLEKQDAKKIQKGIASEVVRFHVIAHSDSKVDQELKLIIKDKLTKELEPLLKDVDSVKEARIILSENMAYIENLSRKIIASKNFNYSAKASLEYDYFPLKVYGDIALPPGKYEAVRIELGDAKGENWWCLVFPPLCFIDSTYSVVPDSSKEQLQKVLTKDEYEEILIDEDIDSQLEEEKGQEETEQDSENVKIKFKFKFLPFLNDLFNLG